MFIGESIIGHPGTALQLLAQNHRSCGPSPIVHSLAVNVVYTEPEATGAALRATELLAHDLEATITVRALVSVPRQLSLGDPPVSISHLTQLLSSLVERFGSTAYPHFIRVHVCRDKVTTLKRILQPASLVVIGGRKRIWPTFEGRLLRAISAEGHSVAFVDQKTGVPAARWI